MNKADIRSMMGRVGTRCVYLEKESERMKYRRRGREDGIKGYIPFP